MKASVKRHYIDGPHGQLHLRVAGDGGSDKRPLLCFHMSPASGVMYETWAGEMGKDRLVIAPDTPGFGMSDPPESPPEIADYADTLGSLLEAFAAPEADVMGYHTGSKIAVELARQRPHQIKHLVLVAAPVYPEQKLSQQKSDMAFTPPTEDGEHIMKHWRGVMEWRGPNEPLENVMRRFPDFLRGGEKSAWGHRAAFAYTYPEALKDVKQPILVLNPKDDLWDYTPNVKPHLINGSVLDLPDWGHGFLDTHTEEASEIVRPFLDS